MNTFTVTNVTVVDGDTFDATIQLGFDITLRQRVRLRNIDTPECRTRDAEEKKYGFLAKKKLVELIKSAKSMIIRCEPKREKFGRVLAELLLEVGKPAPLNVNAYLCENHYAVPYSGQSKDEVADQHLANRQLLADSLASAETDQTEGAA